MIIIIQHWYYEHISSNALLEPLQIQLLPSRETEGKRRRQEPGGQLVYTELLVLAVK